MLSPSTASIESERFVIVGTIKSWISARLHRGKRQKRVCAGNGAPCNPWYYKKSWISARLHRGKRQKKVCALNEVLKIVSATVYGFLR